MAASHKERIEALESSVQTINLELQSNHLASQQSMAQLEETLLKKLGNLIHGQSKSTSDYSSPSKEESDSDTDQESATDSSSEEEEETKGLLVDNRKPRMVFSPFKGDDPITWLSRANQFFKFQKIQKSEKVDYAAFFLEGDANLWWQWVVRIYRKKRKEIRWKDFEKEVLTRFGPTGHVDHDEALSRIKQTHDLQEYLKEFERCSTLVHGWPEKALLGTFIGGLKPELAKEVKICRPRTVRKAIEYAGLQNDHLLETKRLGKMEPRKLPISNSEWQGNKAVSSLPKPLPTGVKRLTWDEMEKRREKGLCFNCNDRFTPGHKCKVSQAFVIEPVDTEEEEEQEVDVSGEGPVNSFNSEQQEPQISVHALTGGKGPKTMKLEAWVLNKPITILIDNGSSHNFINSKVAEKMGLTINTIPPFEVCVANGERLTCNEVCRDVSFKIQGIWIRADLFSLPLVGLDAVLGIQWLGGLGRVVSDYNKMTMEFMWGDGWVTLSAQPKGGATATEIYSVEKLRKQRGQCFAIHVNHAPLIGQEQDKVPEEVSPILNEFSGVLEEPKTLPPPRPFDHRIPIKNEASPVNVAPYRYAHFQKNEIERQVREMLQNGLIRPSNSPFSSPVLLVKKKDGTWRFCTDYRALNSVTIKDRFPIPTIDDMLDELGGAKFFTKLDLRAGYHQIRVHEADIHKTAFRTHNGHFEYLVMPFGLCNAPSTFQYAMNTIFNKQLRKFVLVFFDDILIYSKDWDEHMAHLRVVLEILSFHRFHIKPSKCAFAQMEVEYLGHMISHEGVKVDQRKIEAMSSWPERPNISALRGFLGLTGYYRKFVKDYGVIAKPLTDMLKKGAFTWTPE
ncbi:uncharacterized protein LOC120008853 [Tripterygium wilfordii]|uniref:uncharacterized protein LOC120008853 n=1 Tax=Tripterygium wilfordii TaxID=458696 RepID=UPI0018F7E7AF|nr:uncharacterized protein LOC120008853 [Tripterygium wilfordii]